MEKPIVLVIMDGVGNGDGGSGDALRTFHKRKRLCKSQRGRVQTGPDRSSLSWQTDGELIIKTVFHCDEGQFFVYKRLWP